MISLGTQGWIGFFWMDGYGETTMPFCWFCWLLPWCFQVGTVKARRQHQQPHNGNARNLLGPGVEETKGTTLQCHEIAGWPWYEIKLGGGTLDFPWNTGALLGGVFKTIWLPVNKKIGPFLHIWNVKCSVKQLLGYFVTVVMLIFQTEWFSKNATKTLIRIDFLI